RVDLDQAAVRAHAANDARLAERLEHGDEARPPPRGAHAIEGRPLARSRPSGSVGPQQLPVELQERPQPPGTLGELETDRTGTVRDEAFDARDELVHQIAGRPLAPCRVPRPAEMPGELEQMIAAASELHHVEHVRWARDEGAREVAVAPPNPGPLARSVPRLAHRIARRLRRPVEPGRVVRQGRAIPEQVARDVAAGAGVREPAHAAGVQGEMQAVRMSMPAAELAALEAHVAIVGP